MKVKPLQIREGSRPLRSSTKSETNMKNPVVISNGVKKGETLSEGSTKTLNGATDDLTETQLHSSERSATAKEGNKPLRSSFKDTAVKSPLAVVNSEKKIKESVDNLDMSVIKKSMNTSVNGPRDIIRAIESGTSEVSELLSSECFVIYECKVCRNLFRSIANFITHKRNYCVEKFSHNGSIDGAHNPPTKGSVTSIRTSSKRDILSLLDKFKDQGVNLDIEPLLTNLNGSSAGIFNGYESFPPEDEASKEIQILGSEGRVIGSRQSPTDTVVSCKTCSAKFTDCTLLNVHAEKCASSKQSFGCPCCPKFFSSMWGVYRHLRRYHGKNNDQVRKLRQMITKKNVPTEAARVKRLSAEISTVTSNEKWLGEMETSLDFSNHCYICGRQFERKAALTSHIIACQKKRSNGLSTGGGSSGGGKKRQGSVGIDVILPEPKKLCSEEVAKSDDGKSDSMIVHKGEKDDESFLNKGYHNSKLSEDIGAIKKKVANGFGTLFPNSSRSTDEEERNSDSPGIIRTFIHESFLNEIHKKAEEAMTGGDSELGDDNEKGSSLKGDECSSSRGDNDDDELSNIDKEDNFVKVFDIDELAGTKFSLAQNACEVSDAEEASSTSLSEGESSLSPPGTRAGTINDSSTDDKDESETEEDFSSTFSPISLYISKENGCHICGKRFRSRSEAVRDVASHLGLYRFCCGFKSCSFKAVSRCDIRNHMIMYHNVAENPDSYIKEVPKEEIFSNEEMPDFLGYDDSASFAPPKFYLEFSFLSREENPPPQTVNYEEHQLEDKE